MPTRLFAVITGCGLLLVVAATSCNIQSPERAIRDPVIQGFSPEAQSIEVVVGETLVFSVRAVDPDNKALRFHFTLADSMVSSGTDFVYVVEDTGLVEVRGVVANGASETFVLWLLQRMPRINTAPVVIDFDPTESRPTVIVGNPLQFSMTAQDPEGEQLRYIFTVDDSVVASSNQYLFLAAEIDRVTIKATAFDPDSASAAHTWDVRVAAEPDSIPPATVVMQSLVIGVEPGELIVRWTAVGDDSLEGLPSEYLVGTSSTPIIDERSWSAASERIGGPTPATPGTIQTMVVRDLKPANFVWVAIRALDDFGNLSPLGNTKGAVTKGMEVFGTVRDAVTGQPAPGVVVELAGLENTTLADGSFALTELPEANARFRLRDEPLPGPVGAYFDMRTDPWIVQHGAVVDYWMMPNVTLQTTEYTSFLDFFTGVAEAGGPLGVELRTWDFPVDVYVPPFVSGGLDYEAKMKESFNRWEQILGLNMFTLVDTVPTLGVHVEYRSDISADNYHVLEWETNFLPIRARINMRTFYDSTSVALLETIGMHEIGHAIGMAHSNDQTHLMVGGVTPTAMAPTLDEIWLARAIVRIQRGTPITWYLSE